MRTVSYDIPIYKTDSSFSSVDLYEMDDEEFELRFGVSKDEALEEDAFMQTAGVPIDRLRKIPTNDLPSTKNVEEKLSTVVDTKVEDSKSAIENKTPERQTKPTKALPTKNNKPTTKAPNQSVDMLDLRRKAYKEALVAGKEFNLYVKAVSKRTRGKMQRAQINLMKRAIDRKVKDANVKVGSQEWVTIVKEFFPDAPVQATVEPEASNEEKSVSEQVQGVKEAAKADNKPASSDKLSPKTKQEAAPTNTKESKKPSPAPSPKTNGEQAKTTQADIAATVDGGADAMVESLNKVPATEMLNDFNAKSALASEALKKDAAKAAESLPKIKTPTGLEPSSDTKKPQDEVKPKMPQVPTEFEAEKQNTKTPTIDTSGLKDDSAFNVKQELVSPDVAEETEEGVDQEALAENATAQINIDTAVLPDEIGTAPDVPITGTANPDIVNGSEAEAQELTAEATALAQSYSQGDFGEQNILPAADDSIITAEREIQAKEITIEAVDAASTEIPAELVGELDSIMGTEMEPRIAKEQEAFKSQSEAKKKETDQAHVDADKEIGTLQEDAAKEQLAEKERAGAAIDSQKESYNQEVAQLQNDFQADVDKESASSNTQIGAEKAKGETEAQKHFDKAEKEAAKEKAKAENEAEKQKGDKKKEKKGLWGAITNAVSAVVDAVKDAVNSIFEGLRALVKGIFEAAKKLALAAIDLAAKAITGLIKVFASFVKGLISILFAAFPGIQEKLLGAIDNLVNKAIEAVNKVASKLKTAVTAALDFLSNIIDMALAFVQEIYNIAFSAIGMIVRGEFAELGKYVLKAAVSLVLGTLKQFMAMLGIDMTTLDKIIADPIGFFKNLIAAVKGGIKQFVGNIKKHLMSGLAGWLFGTMSGAGIQLPSDLSLKSIVFLVLQILDLTWGAVRGMIVKQLGPKGEAIMGRVEQAVDVVADIVTRGPIALVDHIKDFVGGLKETLIGGIIEWVRNTIIVKAIAKLISYFNPAGAIIAVVEGLIKTVMFLKERWDQIKSFCQAVMSSIKEVASGNVDSAKGWIENSLGKAIPITLGFLAKLIGLGGISAKIKKIIKKVRKPIDKALKKVVGFVVKKAKKIGGKLVGGAKKAYRKGKDTVKGAVRKVTKWWKKRKKLTTKAGEEHTVFFKGGAKDAQLMVASDPTPAFEFLRKAKEADPNNKPITKEAGRKANEILDLTKKLSKATDDQKIKLNNDLDTAVKDFVNILKKLTGVTEIEPKVNIVASKGVEEPKIVITEGGRFNNLIEAKKNNGWNQLLGRIRAANINDPSLIGICADYVTAIQNPWDINEVDIKNKLQKVIDYLESISAPNRRISDGKKTVGGYQLWSGAKKQAMDESDKDLGVALETSILGGLFDNGDLEHKSWESSSELWKELSALYAQNITGKVRIHQYRGLRKGSVFADTESKEILKKEKNDGLKTEVILYANWGDFIGLDQFKIPVYGAKNGEARKEAKEKMSLTAFMSREKWSFGDDLENKGGFWSNKKYGGWFSIPDKKNKIKKGYEW